MDEIISKILNIDKDAEDRLIKAEEDKSAIIKEAKLKELKIKEECILRADNRIEKVEQSEKQNAQEEIEKLNQILEKQKQKLDDLFEQNKSEWEDEIVKRIVGE